MSVFHFKQFSISQSNSQLKVGTDAMLLGAFASCLDAKKGLDIGAGTGVLTLMTCQKNASIHMDAIEIDKNSYLDLNLNISNSIFSDRITVENLDFFQIELSKSYDFIISNPPFYDDGIKFEIGKSYHSKHTNFFPKNLFFNFSEKLLSKNGTMWIIVPYLNTDIWIREAFDNNLFLLRKIDIEGKRDVSVRSILVFSKSTNNPVIEERFVVRDENGFYTFEYIELTKDFHFKKPLK